MKYYLLSCWAICILLNPGWEDYLGPQRAIGPGGDRPFPKPITTKNPPDPYILDSLKRRAADLKVKVSVIEGSAISIDWTKVVITSLIDGRVKTVGPELIKIDPNKKYILGIVNYPDDYFRRIRCFDVVLTEGPLAGSIFHFRDGTFADKKGDLVAVYEVPDSVPISKSVSYSMFYYVQK